MEETRHRLPSPSLVIQDVFHFPSPTHLKCCPSVKLAEDQVSGVFTVVRHMGRTNSA